MILTFLVQLIKSEIRYAFIVAVIDSVFSVSELDSASLRAKVIDFAFLPIAEIDSVYLRGAEGSVLIPYDR